MEKGSSFSGDGITDDDDIDHAFSCEYVNCWVIEGARESFGDTISTDFHHHGNVRKDYQYHKKENGSTESHEFYIDSIQDESLFSVEVLKKSDQDQHAVIGEQNADHNTNSRFLFKKVPILGRSRSVSNLKVNVVESSEDSSSQRLVFHRFYSFGDLNKLSELQNSGKSFHSEVFNEKHIVLSSSNVKPEFNVNGNVRACSCIEDEGLSFVRYDFIHNHNSGDELEKFEQDNKIKGDSSLETSYYTLEKLSPEEFSMKRVEHWISKINIHDDPIVEEPGESFSSVSMEDSQIVMDTLKPDARSIKAMEIALNCVSSLTSASSSLQMADLGLVIVPVLTPFVSLRVLNLSGNAIVRVISGLLPKGLHVLDLSKNNISYIEGFRDLSRLRVLDLSYNKIARIGHGLSSCSSLKELYLAGNKISEVEGLHRLLKLNIIDLRFNKISTLKGLGQLAANHSSLQAINIEGNPTQKNIRDEQLKKFLIDLLPNLVHYNKIAVKMRRSKEVSTHFDRGIRTEHKLPRRKSLGSGLQKLAYNHESKGFADRTSKKLTKDRHLCMQLSDQRRSQSTKALQDFFTSEFNGR